jgi:hypothetical protein
MKILGISICVRNSAVALPIDEDLSLTQRKPAAAFIFPEP